MSETDKSQPSRPKESYDQTTTFANGHIRNIKSSESSRIKTDISKHPPSKYFLLPENSLLEKNSGLELPQTSPHQKYRIKTAYNLPNTIQKLKQQERGSTAQPKGYVETPPNSRQLNPLNEKEAYKGRAKPGVLEIETLHEETLQLKRQVNALTEENIKLKTRNTNLEREATKFEKMFQEVSLNPKKKIPLAKMDEANNQALKQIVRDLKNELEDKDEELTSLKKKTKVTKITELEVQLRSFQEESMKLRAFINELMAKGLETAKPSQDRSQISTQDSQLEKLKKELQALEAANKEYEKTQLESKRIIAEQEKKLEKEQKTNRQLQEKEKEAAKLQSQLMGSSLFAMTGKRPSGDQSSDQTFRKELEKSNAESTDLRKKLEEKEEYILKLERLLELEKSKGTTISEKQIQQKPILDKQPTEEPMKVSQASERSETRENENLKKVISNPSYTSQKKNDEEPQKNYKKIAKEEPVEIVEKKISQEEVRKFGYQINLSFRVKRLTFEDVEGLNWGGSIQKDGMPGLSKVQEILQREMFGLHQDEANTLAKYLVQENCGEMKPAQNIEGLKSTLTGIIGPLPFWDQEMRRKLYHDISEICSMYKESLEEGLLMCCDGDFFTRKTLEEAAKSIDINFTFAQLEYIVTKVYERTHDANKMSIDLIFEIFHNDLNSKQDVDVPEQKNIDKKTQKDRNDKASKESGRKKKIKESYEDLDAEYKQELDNMLQEFEVKNETKENLRKSEEKTKEDEYSEEFDEEKFEDNLDFKKEIEEEKNNKVEEKEKERFLFPKHEEKKQDKITEKGEDEEDDDDFYQEEKFDEEINTDRRKQLDTDRQKKSEPADEEYKEEEFEDETKEDPKSTSRSQKYPTIQIQDEKQKIKSPGHDEEEEEKKKKTEEEEEEEEEDEYKDEYEKVDEEEAFIESTDILQIRDGPRRAPSGGSDPTESRQMMESAKTNFTNSTQITEPRSDFFHFEESKERVAYRNEQRDRDVSDGTRAQRNEDTHENQREQKDQKKRLPDIIEEFDKQAEIEDISDKDFDEDYE